MISFTVVIKETLEMIGIAAGIARGPIKGLGEEKRARLREIVKTVQ